MFLEKIFRRYKKTPRAYAAPRITQQHNTTQQQSAST